MRPPLRSDPRRPDPAAVAEAVRALRAGALVILPTETVYGLAADPRQSAAMTALCAAKGRPGGKPVALLAPGLAAVREQGARLPAAAEALARRFWPGPLTLVLETPRGPEGYRVPDHAVPRAVLRELGRPVAATSANRSGGADPRTAAAALAAVGAAVAVAIDAGPVPGGVPSTVVVFEGDAWRIARTGALDETVIRATVKEL